MLDEHGRNLAELDALADQRDERIQAERAAVEAVEQEAAKKKAKEEFLVSILTYIVLCYVLSLSFAV
jgi:hypothetical protein